MATRKKTIHDLAKMGGVCIATVSRVVNNSMKVRPETRRRILRLIEQTNYRPNALGRGLVLRRSYNLMLQMPNISDPYSASVAKSVSKYCRSGGYQLVLGDSDYDPVIEAEHLRRARDGIADGLLVSPLPTDQNIPYFIDLVHAGFPVVAMDNPVPSVPINCVRYDDAAGAAMAMDYLFQKGHQNIAFLQWRATFQTVRDRREAYLASFAERGRTANPDHIISAPESLQSWSVESLARLLQGPHPATAILTENEIMAMVCISALERLGKRVPQDVAVIAFGDALLDQFTSVSLTTISLHQDEASRRAVQLLLELIENPARRADPPQQYVQKPELIIRASA